MIKVTVAWLVLIMLTVVLSGITSIELDIITLRLILFIVVLNNYDVWKLDRE